MLGVGRSLEEALFDEVAARVPAAYERVSTGEPLGGRISAIAARLDAPLITGARLVLPRGFVAVEPHALPGLVAGQEVFVVGKLEEGAGAGEVALEGTLAGAPVALRWPLAKGEEGRLPVLSRRWAEARIAELSAAGDPASANEIVALSQKHHVLSDRTALLVLENDRMFAAFGIPRTAGGEQLANPGGVAPGASDPAAKAAGLGLVGTGEGFGSGMDMGRLSSDHKTSVPQLRMGATTVSGRLPPEVIQRIVRQHFGRFRLCYEKGLLSNPTLAGRVVVQFGIGSSGEVTAARNGGSDLPDNGVVQCVVRAFQGISFPAPEGGTVTVRYPILFSPDGGGLPRRSFAPRATEPSATHLAGDEAWRAQGEEALVKLRKALAEDPSRRQRHEALLRALLGRGRFEEALAEARSYAALDPDGAQAQELLASAAAASGERKTALVALDTLVSLAPRDPRAHERAALAFEATGDERRACAHWRSRAELLPASEDALQESRRCRARVLGEREAVLGEIHGMERPGEKTKALEAALARGEAPAHVEPQSGAFQANLHCDGESAQCPWLAVLLPDGTVLSPATPGRGGAGGAWVSLAYAAGGTYRTLAVGGAPGITATIEVRAYGSTRKVVLPPGDGVRTAIVTTVEEPGFGAGVLH
jgi:Ca-activated chloride channel family protein